jgi:hypothetical protein
MRAKAGHSISFILLGAAIGSMTLVPGWLPYLNEFSLREANPHWWQEVMVLLAGAALMIAVLRISAERAAELAQRPRRFVALLLLGTVVAALCMLMILPLLKHGQLRWPSAASMLNTWWETLLWGGLVGWLYVLTLQRSEDQEQLDVLQLRRALLARELARSRLGAARAQIDPAAVARILRAVHGRYRANPEAAALLLDRLIAYLRLAMQRVHRAAPTVAAETDLLQAVAALHEAENDVTIACTLELAQVDSRVLSHSLLPVVRALLDAAAQSGASSLRLDCRLHDGALRIALSLLGAAIGAEDRVRLTDALAQLLPGSPDLLQYVIEPGVHTYAVHLALR